MFLPYTITLGLFALAGLSLSIWSGLKIYRARDTKEWVKAEATIKYETQAKKSEYNLPQISYYYSADGKSFQQIINDNVEESPMPGHAHPVLNKYPDNSSLNIYYNPLQPSISSLNNGAQAEDLVMFWIGITTMLLGLATFL